VLGRSEVARGLRWIFWRGCRLWLSFWRYCSCYLSQSFDRCVILRKVGGEEVVGLVRMVEYKRGKFGEVVEKLYGGVKGLSPCMWRTEWLRGKEKILAEAPRIGLNEFEVLVVCQVVESTFSFLLFRTFFVPRRNDNPM
jgi:hypothetical protein